jgi:hypothetical protein
MSQIGVVVVLKSLAHGGLIGLLTKRDFISHVPRVGIIYPNYLLTSERAQMLLLIWA